MDINRNRYSLKLLLFVPKNLAKNTINLIDLKQFTKQQSEK
jgi:hypothetical protein